MLCANHANNNGINTCSRCGQWLCEECSVEVNGRIVCKSCIYESLSKAPKSMPRRSSSTSASEIYISKFMLIICSIVPGANYMYMGLMKRGILAMLMFALVAFLNNITDNFISAFLIIGIVANFFDGIHIRRRLMNGQHVEDNLDEIFNFVSKHKHIFILLAGILLANVFFVGVADIFNSALNIFFEIWRMGGGGKLSFLIFLFLLSLIAITLIAICIILFFRIKAKRATSVDKNKFSDF